ncbi:uncharacterized protein SCHCODRAFT_02621577 [Schizophyllum commune H4-8]|uniref:uncharacterized protein n=1 Tax=Schizophyllum commune (strain H4-8 / FGSC 9210) TaxID=578458 RepID=UPI00215E2A32|nr:uncharacterized protein SCHCODRAFT_02621577 [Schizophyllum commune H4-8]KAI5893358.1 hypothetical protein SCHCODRAFT_02621577 [Schizophyllum commune H4-8]
MRTHVYPVSVSSAGGSRRLSQKKGMLALGSSGASRGWPSDRSPVEGVGKTRTKLFASPRS